MNRPFFKEDFKGEEMHHSSFSLKSRNPHSQYPLHGQVIDEIRFFDGVGSVQLLAFSFSEERCLKRKYFLLKLASHLAPTIPLIVRNHLGAFSFSVSFFILFKISCKCTTIVLEKA